MMKWWLKNGYPPELAKTDRVAATKVLTESLKSRFDAIYHKGGGFKTIDMGPQVVVFDTSRIYMVDPKLAKPGDIGCKVRNKSTGTIGTLSHKRTIPQDIADQYWGGETVAYEVRWPFGIDRNTKASDIEFVQAKAASSAISEVPISSLLLNPHS